MISEIEKRTGLVHDKIIIQNRSRSRKKAGGDSDNDEFLSNDSEEKVYSEEMEYSNASEEKVVPINQDRQTK